MSEEHGTLLIVDDEPQILTVLQRTLTLARYKVFATTSPAEALAILGKEPINVLISDLDMPSMSGIELLRRARASFPKVMRILLTGRGSLESAVEAINQGEVYRYLTKPWQAEVLLSTVAEALRRGMELQKTEDLERAGSRQAELLIDLESRYSGITAVPPDGSYWLDEERLEALASEIGVQELTALLKRP